MNSSQTKAKVLIVEDHPIVRQGVARLLDGDPGFCVCGEADCARQALAAIEEVQPDAAIIDIALPGINGIELIKNIIARWPGLPLLVLSMHDETLYAERALRAGAKGYVMKEEATEDLICALHRILDGQIYVSERLSRRLMHKAINGKPEKDTSPVAVLSDRELEVLQQVGLGHGTRQIAEDLSVSFKTVESHRAHIKEKLHLQTAPELMRFAVQWVSQGTL
jgi:DNA-binding NarL/FixJ family response regulator